MHTPTTPKLRLLFVVLDAGRGGHTRTALALGDGLNRLGHSIRFLIGEQADEVLLRDSSFSFGSVSADENGCWPELERSILPTLLDDGIDVVHVFSPAGLLEVSRCCSRRHVPLFWSICSTYPPTFYEIPRIPGVIALTHELRDHLVRLHGYRKDQVPVIAARLDTAELSEAITRYGSAAFEAFRAKYGIDAETKIVTRVQRIHARFEAELMWTANSVARLARRSSNVAFLHFGFVEGEDCFLRLQEVYREINESLGARVLFSITDEAMEAHRYLPMADVIVGTGKAALEGMFSGTPTIVVGEYGYAGPVQPQNVATHERYNFMGRQVAAALDPEETIEATAVALADLLSDERGARQLGRWSREFVQANFSAEQGAREYEDLYLAGNQERLPALELSRAAAVRWILTRLRTVVPRSLRRTLNDAIYAIRKVPR